MTRRDREWAVFAGGFRRSAADLLMMILGAGILVSCPLFLGGCGYTAGSLVPREYSRVFLPLFENQTFFRDLEIALTQQVERELGSRPGVFIVSPEEADIVLRGTIEGFQQRVLSEDDRDRIRESSAVTTVRIEIQDARNPENVLRTFRVVDRAEFFLARGENLASAQAESFFDIARRIVNELETEFARPSLTQAGKKDTTHG